MKKIKDMIPKILSIVNRYEPDNSGGCCPICANGCFDYELCDICHNTRYERREIFEYSEHVDEGSHVCSDCIFEVRQDNGTAKRFCWVCLKEKYDITKLRECPECYIFDYFEEEECKWCRELGPFWSLYRSKGFPPLSKNEIKVVKKFALDSPWNKAILRENELDAEEGTLQSLKEKKVIYDSQCGAERHWRINNWMETWNRRKRNPDIPKREPRIFCRYDDIMNALTRDDEVIEAIFRYLSVTNNEEAEDIIVEKIENLKLNNSRYEAIGGVYHILEKRIDLLENHPKYGKYFRAFHDRDIRAQQEFLASMDWMSNVFLFSFVREIRTRDDFVRFLYENKDWPTEIKLVILENARLENDADPWKWRHELYQKAAPEEFARVLAIKFSIDPDEYSRSSIPGIRGNFGLSKRVFNSLVDILSNQSINIKARIEGYPYLHGLARNGEFGAREIAILLTDGSINPKIPVPERMMHVYHTLKGNPGDLSLEKPLAIFRDYVSKQDDKSLKEQFLVNRWAHNKYIFFDTLFDAGLFDIYFRLSQPLDDYQNIILLSNFIISGLRTGHAGAVRKILIERTRSMQNKINELNRSQTCGKSLEIISNMIDIIGINIMIDRRKEALKDLKRLTDYINALIAECKKNNLHAEAYQWMFEILRREDERIINDINRFYACATEMSEMPLAGLPQSALSGLNCRYSSEKNMAILLLRPSINDDSLKAFNELYDAIRNNG